MVWFLPLVIIGGLFYAPLGYLVFAMMLFMLALSYFRKRFWCANLCPRGAFLDLLLSRVSLKKKIPGIFTRLKFRWLIFVVFMLVFAFRIITVEKNLYQVGFLFVQMCLVTTIISIVLGVTIRERAWCVICPMGTLQSKIGSLKKT